MTMRRGVSFDFFDTLVELDHDVPTVAAALTTLGYPCTPELERIWNSPGFDGQVTHRSGQAGHDAWRRDCLAKLAILCGAPAERALDIADELIDIDRRWTVRASQWAADLLAAVGEAGATCCILSNWDYPLAPYLAMAGLDPAISVVTSAELGCRKPCAESFSAARALMNVTADRHLHVGDSWDADVCGAIRSGAQALWITSMPPDGLPPAIIAVPPERAADRLRRWLHE